MSPLSTLLLVALALPQATALVADGAARDVEVVGAPWTSGEGYLEAQGTGRTLVSRRAVRGDFVLRARLTLFDLERSAASFVYDETNHFGFEGAGGALFVEGPLFGGKTRPLGPTPVQAGRTFAFEARREGDRLAFSIDGDEVAALELPEHPPARLALRPWRSRMRVHRLDVDGDLVELAPEPEAVDLFVAGEGGYHTYRIPSLLATPAGSVLAFCEGRRASSSDSGDIDLLVRRSTDGGRTWGPPRVVAEDAQNTVGNPCPVVDRRTGTIHLLLTWNLGSDHEREIMAGTSEDTRRVFVCRSVDDGVTWAEREELTESVKDAAWRWYATGPGVGIQLRDGRLVVPGNHSFHESDGHPYRTHVIVSDDGGETWGLGGVAGERVNESQVVQRRDGSLLLNMRSYHGKNRRAIAESSDRGGNWTSPRLDEALIEPVCQASLIAWPGETPENEEWILFANPASTTRERMTVRLSLDGGRTWPHAMLLYRGSSAYCCLAALPDGTAGCLYERDGYGRISLARFTIDELRSR